MKKILFCLTVLFLTLIVADRSIAQTKEARDWPGFLGPNRDGKSAAIGLIKDWSGERLKVRWSRTLGESYAAPGIENGELYHFDRIDDKNTLFKLDAQTGKIAWKYEYETSYQDMYGYTNGPRCSPIISGDRVIVYGPEGELHCVARKDGKKIWSVDTAKDYGVIQNFFGVGSSPVVYKNLLIAMVGGSPKESKDIPRGQLNLVKPNGTAIVAFDIATGKEEYSLGNDLASYSSMVVQKVGDETMGLAFCRSGLIGFDPDNGKQKFSFAWRARSLESVNASTPIVFDRNKILISECYSIGTAVLEWTGTKIETVWKDGRGRNQSLMTHWNTPIEIDGFVYGSSGRHSREAILRCLDASTGKVQWEKQGLTRSTLTWIDDHFILLTEMGELKLIQANPKSFKEVTSYSGPQELRYPCWAAPVVADGNLYILSKNKLVCFELIKQ